MLTDLRRRMDKQRESFNKETENIGKYQTKPIEMKKYTRKIQ